METTLKLYYYTGTGNTLCVAKHLAELIPRMISCPAIRCGTAGRIDIRMRIKGIL